MDLDNHGPYPDDWSQDVRDFWDAEPNTVRDFYSESEWDSLQENFYNGFVAGQDEVTPDERHEAREAFFNEAGITHDSFDWDEFRDYHGYGEAA